MIIDTFQSHKKRFVVFHTSVIKICWFDVVGQPKAIRLDDISLLNEKSYRIKGERVKTMKVVIEKNLEEINHGVTPHLSIFKDLKKFF